jgi:hypothetical protein
MKKYAEVSFRTEKILDRLKSAKSGDRFCTKHKLEDVVGIKTIKVPTNNLKKYKERWIKFKIRVVVRNVPSSVD